MGSLVSVIVPIYKVEEYLDRCLESIVNQTYRNIEIILVDDGSPDACPQKCDSWAEKDSRIKVIHKANAGLGFARNSGLDLATGDYITFVDSDDYISLDAIKVMLTRIENDQSDIVIAQNVKVYCDGTQDSSAYPWITDRVITNRTAFEMMGTSRALPVYAWGKLYRREIFDTIRYQALKCAEDVYVFPDIIEQCETISLVGAVIYFYFQRDTSIVHTKQLVQKIDNIVASLRVSRFLLERNYSKGASRYYYAAVCQYFDTKRDRKAKRLLKDAFDRNERKTLRKSRDSKMARVVFAARFPNIYKLFKRILKS